MRIASRAMVAVIVVLMASRAAAQGYVPPSATPVVRAPATPDPRPAWWSTTPTVLEPPAPPEWLRARRRGRALLIPGVLALEASLGLAGLAGLSANPICIDLGFDEFDEGSSCPGNDRAAAGFAVASGIVGAVGIGLTIAGGVRVHRVRAERRLRESSLRLSIEARGTANTSPTFVYTLRF